MEQFCQGVRGNTNMKIKKTGINFSTESTRDPILQVTFFFITIKFKANLEELRLLPLSSPFETFQLPKLKAIITLNLT